MSTGFEYPVFRSVGDYNIANKSLKRQKYGCLEGAL